MDTNKHKVPQKNQSELSVKEQSASRLLQIWEAGDNYLLKIHNAKLSILKRSILAFFLAFILNVILCSPLLMILFKFNNTVPFLICWLGTFGLIGGFGAVAALISRWGLSKAGFPPSVQSILALWNAALFPSIVFGPIILMVFLQFEISAFLSIPLFCALPGFIGGVTASLTITAKAKERDLIASSKLPVDQ